MRLYGRGVKVTTGDTDGRRTSVKSGDLSEDAQVITDLAGDQQ